MVGLLSLCMAKSKFKRPGIEDHVAISKQQPGRCSLLGSHSHRMRLAQPPCRQFADVHHPQAMRTGAARGIRGNLVHALSSPVAGTVVDSDDLKPQSPGSKQRPKRGLNGILFIARWNNNCEIGS